MCFRRLNSQQLALILYQVPSTTTLTPTYNPRATQISWLLPLSFCNCVAGDGEGGIEMTESMQLIREFCDLFVTPEKVTRTRIVSIVYMSSFILILPSNFLFKVVYSAITGEVSLLIVVCIK